MPPMVICSLIDRWLWERISSGISAIISSFTIEQLLKERKSIEIAIKNEIEVDLIQWGFELEGIEIQGINVPEDYRNVLEFESQMRIISAKSALEQKKLKTELELEKMKQEAKVQQEISSSTVDYHKKLTSERTRIDTLSSAKQAGIDPVELIKAEAVKTSADLGKMNVKVDLSSDMTSHGYRKERIEKYKNLLEKLEERIISGEISESIYKELAEKYKKIIGRENL